MLLDTFLHECDHIITVFSMRGDSRRIACLNIREVMYWTSLCFKTIDSLIDQKQKRQINTSPKSTHVRKHKKHARAQRERMFECTCEDKGDVEGLVK